MGESIFDGTHHYAQYSASCLVLDVQNQRWDENKIGPLNSARQQAAAVSLETIGTFVLGGRMRWSGQNQRRTSEFLAEGASQWVWGPDIPVDMAAPCAVKHSQSSFLLIFDKDIREYQADIADPTSSSGWQPAVKWPQLQISRKETPGCSKIENLIVIAGGNYHETPEVLDLSTRTISFASAASVSRIRFHMATITQDGQSYAFALAGDIASRPCVDTVEQFHPNNNSWTLSPAKTGVARRIYGAAVVATKLICPNR